jgi:dephospho-CoA kinase
MSPPPLRPPLAIGLTGGIGSGKSTVAARWVALGAVVVDSDAIAHSLTAPGGAAMPAIRTAFGDGAVAADGALDRVHMRALVFADLSAKARLEGILHPMIGAETRRQAEAAAAAGCPAVVYDVPLLTESRTWRARCDRILVVDCPVDTQVARVMARSGWAEDQVRRVIGQQATREARRAIADAVIVNEGKTPDMLAAEVSALWRAWGLPPTPAAG